MCCLITGNGICAPRAIPRPYREILANRPRGTFRPLSQLFSKTSSAFAFGSKNEGTRERRIPREKLGKCPGSIVVSGLYRLFVGGISRDMSEGRAVYKSLEGDNSTATSWSRISVDLASRRRRAGHLSPFIIAVNRFILDSLPIHHSRLSDIPLSGVRACVYRELLYRRYLDINISPRRDSLNANIDDCRRLPMNCSFPVAAR